jgi:hypothetical protein
MDYILQVYEEAKIQFFGNDIMTTSINAGWEKFEKYYTSTDDSPVYNTAVVLHPSNKWEYVETVWEDQPQWISTAKANVRAFWQGKYHRVLNIKIYILKLL